MPIELLSNIGQKNRAANVSSTAFFYLVDSSNIDYRINGIQNDNTLIAGITAGLKYIIRDSANLHFSFGTIPNVSNNDIVIRDNNGYSVYVDVSNSKTNRGGVVYNDTDDKLYYYNGSIWRSLGLGSLTGTVNQISIAGSTGDIKIALTPIVIIENYIQTPQLRFNSGGATMGGISAGMQISGNLNITGNLLVDGEIITKTAFRGYSSDADIEIISDVEIDSGEY